MDIQSIMYVFGIEINFDFINHSLRCKSVILEEKLLSFVDINTY